MKIFYTIIIFFWISNIQAQKNQITYGIKGGANLSVMTGRPSFEKVVPRISYHIGGVIEIPLSDRFSIQPELLYSEQGSKLETELEIRQSANDLPILIDSKQIIKLNYINVPILVKYYFNDKFNFSLGPQIGYLVSAKIKLEAIPELDIQEDLESDAKDAYKSIDVSAKFGLGYVLDNNVFFQASYGLGVTKINEFDSPFGDAKRNSVFQLSMGYKF